jgi:hypothetical protein
VYAGPETSQSAFRDMVQQAAQDALEAEQQKAETALNRKEEQLRTRLTREQQRLRENQDKLSQRNQQKWISYGETAMGMFGIGRKKSLSTSMSKRGMSSQAQAAVDKSAEDVARIEQELKALAEERQATLAQLRDKWAGISADTTTIPLQPLKKDVVSDRFGIAWLPHYVVRQGGRTVELPAFRAT